MDRTALAFGVDVRATNISSPNLATFTSHSIAVCEGEISVPKHHVMLVCKGEESLSFKPRYTMVYEGEEMTKKATTTRSASDGNVRAIFWFMKNIFNPPGQFHSFITTSAGVSAANSSIDMDDHESQSCNRILTMKAIATIVAAIAIAKQMTNLQRAFAGIIVKSRGCLMRSMWPSVVVNNISDYRQGTNTFQQYLFMPAQRSLSRKNISCLLFYHTYECRIIFRTADICFCPKFLHMVRNLKNWREHIQNFVFKYPFRGSVERYQDLNIFIFLVLKEIPPKENLLVQNKSFVLVLVK